MFHTELDLQIRESKFCVCVCVGGGGVANTNFKYMYMYMYMCTIESMLLEGRDPGLFMKSLQFSTDMAACIYMQLWVWELLSLYNQALIQSYVYMKVL